MSGGRNTNSSKPFHCECGKGFRTAYTLQRHQSSSCLTKNSYSASPNIGGVNVDEISAEENNRISSLSVTTEPPSKMRKSSNSSNEFQSSSIPSETNSQKRKQPPEQNIQGRSVVIVTEPRKKVRAYSHHNVYGGSNAAADTTRSAQSSKLTMHHQANAYSSNRLVDLSSSKGTVADISEPGRPIHQTSANKKTTSMCVARVPEEQIGGNQYDNDSSSASDSEVRDVSTQTEPQYINIQLAIHGGNTFLVSTCSNK